MKVNIKNYKHPATVVNYCPVCKEKEIMIRAEKKLKPEGYPWIMYVYKCTNCKTIY